MIHNLSLKQGAASLAPSQGRNWSLLLAYPEALYPFIQLSSYHSLAHPMPKCRVNVMVFPQMKKLRSYLSRLKLSRSEVMVWHEMDYWGENRHGSPMEEMKDRMSVLVAIASGQPITIATTCLAMLETTISADQFKQDKLVLSRGDEIHPEHLVHQLKRGGYLLSDHQGGYGTYHQNDGHIHISPPGSLDGLKLKLSADNKILAMEPSFERGKGSLGSYEIYPAHEAVMDEGARDQTAQVLYESLLDQNIVPKKRSMMMEHFHKQEPFSGYFKLGPLLRKGAGQKDHTLLDHLIREADGDFFIWNFMTTDEQEQAVEAALSRAEECYEQERSAGEPTIHPRQYFASQTEINEAIAEHGYLATLFADDGQAPEDSKGALCISWDYMRSTMHPPANVTASTQGRMARGFVSIEDCLRQILAGERLAYGDDAGDTKWVFLCKDQRALGEWQILLEEAADQVVVLAHPWDIKPIYASEATVFLAVGTLVRDYFLIHENIHYIPTSKLQGKPARSHSQQAKDTKWQDYLRSLSDITVGDLVVHREHGVGRYLGLVDLGVHGGGVECLKIEYGGGDKVYVPIHHLSILQKYASRMAVDAEIADGEADHPARPKGGRLDYLSQKASWKKRSSKAKKSVKDLADEILKIHSRRKLAGHPPYAPPPKAYEEFVDAFPYVETDDQLRFCDDMEADFTSQQTMDRLLIGDVGFGKTEMAMRAAMRTVLEGYQVMVLTPTTVLCYQHEQTFLKRMSSFAVNIKGANRFVKPAELRRITAEFAAGTLDILIGTHKILSKAFQPKKLGLIIIDEEQRFGVSHKEKLKGLRAEASVLSLSATPIPRTMHMSMLGLRDISLLTIPPEGRRAVKNVVTTWDNQLIERAIRGEIRRGGQVFCVHNRVSGLDAFARTIKALVPELEVRTAHGQLKEAELEEVIMDFSQNNFPILVCTSIMESGVDMPNVNTLIVHNSQRYGLSQLYQLRGRVGRSSVQAYAYFITPPKAAMSHDAQKRMQVMMAYQALGSGFSIASYDMDLRGVGDLLGDEQSGHVATVGLEMYTTLLDEALKKARGEKTLSSSSCEIHLSVEYGIPQDYIVSENTRLRLYKKLFHLTSEEEISKLAGEIADEYGPLPKPTVVLTQVALIKLGLRHLAAQSFRETSQGGVYVMEINQLPGDLVDTVLKATIHQPQIYALQDPQHIVINLSRVAEEKRLTLLSHKIRYLYQGA